MAESKKHVLVVGGHIGDAEITGGLLAAKYAAAGHRVTLLHMTAGEKGNPKMDHQAYRAQRLREADAFACGIGNGRVRGALTIPTANCT